MKRAWQVGVGARVVRSLDRLTEILLAQRNVATTALEEFFTPSFAGSIHDPMELPDMGKARERILRAIEKRERILVYGDYDADGVTATAILVTVLRELGGHVVPYLPHRLDDGYALNQGVLARLLPEFDVLITADCGVSNVEEIEWLNKQGKSVIVADHHEVREKLPPAAAVVHPRVGHYPFGYLSGAGVAWKIAQALVGEKATELLDLAALGTLADVVPLIGENRAIVKFGLSVMRRTQRPGLKALLAACRIEPAAGISTEDLVFRVIPRLNAAGRMDHPQPALDVLLADSPARAQRLVEQLNGYNQKRQTLTRKIMLEATADVDPSLPFVFSANDAWPAGVVGLVAGRLAEKFARPAIVVGGNGRHAVGSARAPAGANVLELLKAGEEHLMKLGGHERAAGFSLAAENIAEFKEALAAVAKQISFTAHGDVLRADAVVDHTLLSWDLLELVEKLSPFGEANTKPKFVAKNLSVLDARVVGKTSAHGRLTVAGAHEPIEAIGFDLAQQVMGVEDTADALFSVEVNEFRGQRRLQLVLEDVAPSGSVTITA